MREAEFLDKALAIVKAAGYRVSKPRSQPSRPQRPDGLNAVGKPYGANDDPNYKLKGVGASIGRLYAPYGPSMRFVGDQRDNTKRARRAFQPVPLLSHSFIEPDVPGVALKKTTENDVPKTRTYRLVFTNKNEFGGAVIIDVSGVSAGKAFSAAIKKSKELKLNPGQDYDVYGYELPPDAIPEQFKRRLLSRAEVDLLNARTQ